MGFNSGFKGLKQDGDFCQQELRGSCRDATNGQQFCIGFQLLLNVEKSTTGTGKKHCVTILKKVREFREQLIFVLRISKNPFLLNHVFEFTSGSYWTILRGRLSGQYYRSPVFYVSL